MTARCFYLLLAGVCLLLWILMGGMSEPSGEELQPANTSASRRLTAVERAQLRDQVRRQWSDRMTVLTLAELHSAQIDAPKPPAGPVTPVRTWPARSQRR